MGILDAAMNDPDRAGIHSWFGYGPDRLSQRFQHEDCITEHGGHLAIEADDGTLAGMASWSTRTNGPRRTGGERWRDSTVYSILRTDVEQQLR